MGSNSMKSGFAGLGGREAKKTVDLATFQRILTTAWKINEPNKEMT